MHKQLHYIAHHDNFTGLPTRKFLMEHLSKAINDACDKNHKLVLMFIDLDNFKTVNDTLDYDAGDNLLKEVSLRFAKCVRYTDIIARLGGDEFVILLPEINNIEDGYEIAEKIKVAMSEKFESLENIDNSASIGLMSYPEHGTTSNELLNAADKAMYVVKQNGGSDYFSPIV